MAGEDTTSAALSASPLQPVAAADCTTARLIGWGDEVMAATVEIGLPHWFWPEGVALLGMLAFAEATGRAVPAQVLDYLQRYPADELKVDHVNDLAPGTAVLLAVEAGATVPDSERIVDRLAAWIAADPTATRAPNGAVEHWPGGVWADTAYMAGLFLGHRGRLRGEPGSVDEFGRQLIAHAEVLQDPVTGLYAHGSHRGETIPSFWGRANAWLALAGVEYLRIARQTAGIDAALDSAVRARLRRQLIALTERQPAHGVWSVLVDDQVENVGILETSAAAGIGAAMLRALPLIDDLPGDVAAAGELAVRGALAYLENGRLTRVSAGTVLQLVPFGYSVIRDDRPQLWGQGLILQALAALLDHLGSADLAPTAPRKLSGSVSPGSSAPGRQPG